VVPLKALYGIYLMRECRKADKIGEREGRFVPHKEISFEEFKANRKVYLREIVFRGAEVKVDG